MPTPQPDLFRAPPLSTDDIVTAADAFGVIHDEIMRQWKGTPMPEDALLEAAPIQKIIADYYKAANRRGAN